MLQNGCRMEFPVFINMEYIEYNLGIDINIVKKSDSRRLFLSVLVSCRDKRLLNFFYTLNTYM